MEESASKENYFSEEGIEKSTQSLMEKLETARDPEAYRQRFHRHGRSTGSGSSGTSAHAERLRSTHLLITLVAILIGAFAGIMLSTYFV